MADRPLDRILIRDLRLSCVVGVKPEERIAPREVVFQIELGLDLAEAARADNLEQTVSYSALAEEISKTVADSNFRLIESLAEEVAQVCLSFAKVKEVRITLDKPGAIAAACSAAVVIVRSR